jgi:DNA-binding transcriptional ArsR family regulator
MNAFAALADDTRLRIVETLAGRECSVTDLVSRFDLSQPAISQHLRVLREAKLVRMRPDKQRRLYSVPPGGLDEIERWLEKYRRKIAKKLDDLERYLDEEEGRKR